MRKTLVKPALFVAAVRRCCSGAAWRRLLIFGVVVLCTAFVASAQENAELTGTVKDPSGAVVANANVTLTDAATGEAQRMATGYTTFRHSTSAATT